MRSFTCFHKTISMASTVNFADSTSKDEHYYPTQTNTNKYYIFPIPMTNPVVKVQSSQYDFKFTMTPLGVFGSQVIQNMHNFDIAHLDGIFLHVLSRVTVSFWKSVFGLVRPQVKHSLHSKFKIISMNVFHRALWYLCTVVLYNLHNWKNKTNKQTNTIDAILFPHQQPWARTNSRVIEITIVIIKAIIITE